MSDLRMSLGLLSLVAACGPVAAQTTSGDDTTDGTSDATDATSVGPGTDPTVTSEPTGSTTTPPPECVDSSDCDDSYCGYCEDGMCIEGVGCCGFNAAPTRPDMQRFRCQPPYDCYGDEDCEPGEVCEFGQCQTPIPLLLPSCAPLGFTLSQWQLDVSPGAFVLADLDGDGDLDLAAAQPSVAQIQIALNDGAGGFVLAGSFGVGEPSEALALAAGDLDGDADIDLAVVRNDAAGGLVLLFGQDAVFTPEKALPTAPNPNAVFIRDIDDDLKNDLVIVSAGNVATRHGSALSEEVIAITDPIGGPATLFDIDASGHADLISPVPASTTVGIYTADAKGAFTPAIFVDTFSEQIASLGGDMTQPGVDDLPALVLARSLGDFGQIDVFPGVDAPEKFGDASKFQTSVPITGATLFEVEDPPGPDLIAATGISAVLVVAGDAAGGFSCERVIPVNNATTLPLLAAGDLDGDGRVDILVGDANTPTITVLRSE